jgi:hypothetical protein
MATKKSKAPSIIEAIEDPALLGGFFRDQGTWEVWKAYLAGLFAVPMEPERLALFRKYTGRTTAPQFEFDKSFLVCGRRSGKSVILAVVACYLGCFRDFRPFMSPGEVGRIRIMAADLAQSRTIFGFVRGLLLESPLLKDRVVKELAQSIALRNNIVIECATSNFKSVRGYTLVAALCDEAAFWQSDEGASNADIEVIRGVEPAMATIPHGKLLVASSPYSKKGILWEGYQNSYGKDDADSLCWLAATTQMNPTVSQAYVDKKLEEDFEANSAEYLAQWRSDLSSFITPEAVRACLDGERERGVDYRNRYIGFVDVAGGSGGDSMTLGISHKVGNTVLLDCVREIRPPFSPQAAIEEYAALLKKYRIATVIGDRFGGDLPREQFRNAGIHYEVCEYTKSELYIALLPLINSRGVVLLDDKRLINQLTSLERRTHRSGRDTVDHPQRGGHDDVVNAAAGALVLTSQRPAGWRRRNPEAPKPLQWTAERFFGPAMAGGPGHEGTGWLWRR